MKNAMLFAAGAALVSGGVAIPFLAARPQNGTITQRITTVTIPCTTCPGGVTTSLVSSTTTARTPVTTSEPPKILVGPPLRQNATTLTLPCTSCAAGVTTTITPIPAKILVAPPLKQNVSVSTTVALVSSPRILVGPSTRPNATTSQPTSKVSVAPTVMRFNNGSATTVTQPCPTCPGGVSTTVPLQSRKTSTTSYPIGNSTTIKPASGSMASTVTKPGNGSVTTITLSCSTCPGGFTTTVSPLPRKTLVIAPPYPVQNTTTVRPSGTGVVTKTVTITNKQVSTTITLPCPSCPGGFTTTVSPVPRKTLVVGPPYPVQNTTSVRPSGTGVVTKTVTVTNKQVSTTIVLPCPTCPGGITTTVSPVVEVTPATTITTPRVATTVSPLIKGPSVTTITIPCPTCPGGTTITVSPVVKVTPATTITIPRVAITVSPLVKGPSVTTITIPCSTCPGGVTTLFTTLTLATTITIPGVTTTVSPFVKVPSATVSPVVEVTPATTITVPRVATTVSPLIKGPSVTTITIPCTTCPGGMTTTVTRYQRVTSATTITIPCSTCPGGMTTTITLAAAVTTNVISPAVVSTMTGAATHTPIAPGKTLVGPYVVQNSTAMFPTASGMVTAPMSTGGSLTTMTIHRYIVSAMTMTIPCPNCTAGYTTTVTYKRMPMGTGSPISAHVSGTAGSSGVRSMGRVRPTAGGA